MSEKRPVRPVIEFNEECETEDGKIILKLENLKFHPGESFVFKFTKDEAIALVNDVVVNSCNLRG